MAVGRKRGPRAREISVAEWMDSEYQRVKDSSKM